MKLLTLIQLASLAALIAFPSTAMAAPGDLDPGFNPDASSAVFSTMLQPDGKIIIGGVFNNIGGVTRNYIARLNTNGTLDTGFNTDANGTVFSTMLQPDGKIIIGGVFNNIGGVTRNYIARLNTDGSLDAGFNPNANNLVRNVVLQSDGKIIIGGNFNNIGGVTRNHIARINPDGSLDAGFNPNVADISSPSISSIALLTDGKIIIGGDFHTVGGVARNHIARINPDGSLDAGFNPNANNSVHSVALQPDGKIIFGGIFTTIGGVTRNHIARINVDGTLDTSFAPNLDGNPNPPVILSAALQTDGKIIIGGDFKTVDGVARNYIARLNTDGSLDAGFNPNANNEVRSVALQADGKIIIGGIFTNVGDEGRNWIARLANDSATQSLSVPNNSRIEWLRGGASPETMQVTFELSTDGANWVLLGLGTSISGGWELAGLSLPVACQLRARARTNGGYGNSSSGLVEANTPFGVHPEIAVEQPALTDIPDGSGKVFGNVLVGNTASLTFTIRNFGAVDLTGLGISIDGVNASDFSLTANPTSPLSGPTGTTTFTVQFAPTAIGVRLAALHLVSNDADENPFDVFLTGTGMAPDIAVEQPALTNVVDGGTKSFGTAVVGSTSSLVFKIKNIGNMDITDLGITFDGTNSADFSVTANPTTPVAGPNGSTTFTVQFAPTGAGARTAALHIVSNVTGAKNPFDINLIGSGADISVEQPALTVLADGGTKNFGNTAVGSNTSLTFTIRNSGATSLTGLAVTLNGNNATDYSVTTNPATTVPVGATTTFVLRFSPGSTGLRTAAMHLASNWTGSKNPYDITLTGTGSGAGNPEATFNSGASSYVLSTAVQPDGRIIVGGGFESMGGEDRNYVARLNADSTLDSGFNPDANDWVYSTAVQPDGKIIIGGSFTIVGGVAHNRIARLNADGTPDSGFNLIMNGEVYSTAVQPDGKIIIGGSFTSVGGVPHNRIARLNADGTLDAGFNPNFDGEVYSLALQPDGRIILGGVFVTAGGAARNHLARLNPDGTLDTTFNPNSNYSVYNVAVQPDGKIIIGGNFTTIGGTARNRIARLNADGTLDAFNPSVNGDVNSTTVQADGKIIIGGSFTSVAGAARNYVARVNADGTIDTGFNPNASSSVFSTALQSDGRIILGGDFSNVGGVPGNRITRLENDAATQSLTMPNASRLQWLRGGASPETVQVTFQLSTDGGGTWTSLGAGSRSRLVTGWELNGLSLPSNGQVRARAQITGGYSNGSSGFVETVASITGLPSAPAISVEQPLLTQISDGGVKDFGNLLVGSNASLTFTIKNTGTANLTGLGITIVGTNADDFTITASPTAPVTGPTGSTSFTVRFAPTSDGTKTAALHIASNVTGNNNPFDINLTGRAFVANADGDGDGITNATELSLASMGFDPLVNNSALLALLHTNAPDLGLYTLADVQFLALGSPLLEKDPTTGHFHLIISIEKSPALSGWTPLLGFTPLYDPMTGKIDIDIPPDASNAQFYRVLGAKP